MSGVLILNGPNLNLLGQREPDYYGQVTLSVLLEWLTETASGLGLTLAHFQANGESSLIERIHGASGDGTDFIIFNPAAYTHTSVALRDALLGVNIPFIEVHLSNVHAREAFRQHSYFSDIAVGVISGLGPIGYELALRAAHNYLSRN